MARALRSPHRRNPALRPLLQASSLARRPQPQPPRSRLRSPAAAPRHQQRQTLRRTHRQTRPSQHRAHPPTPRRGSRIGRNPRLKKKLQVETQAAVFAETEAFLAKAKSEINSRGLGESSEWIETGLRNALLRDARRIISGLYNDRQLLPDNATPAELETLHRDRPRTIETLFGPVELRRHYLHHAKSGSGRFPLDDTLGLEHGCTPAVAKLLCRAASRAGSYREAADDLLAYAGLVFDPRDLGRTVATLAPKLRQALEILPPQTPSPIDVLYVSSDGTGTPMRPEELHGRKGRQEDGTPRTREAKLGCVFTQTDRDALGQPLRDDEGNPLRDPDSTSHVGTYEGCREIAVLLHQEARRRGLDHAKRVVFLGDGAAWVWENARLTFPQAIEILDFYHASEHVGALATAIHDQDPQQAAALRARWCHEMKQTSPDSLLTETRALLDAHPHWPPSKREAIQAQINYLESHATRTRYGDYRRQGLFIGSGVIEAGCKTVIGRRLKQSGMRWSQTGAENILSLRCLVLGKNFNEAWEKLKTINQSNQRKARRWRNQNLKIAA
jgi:hypothetical protein